MIKGLTLPNRQWEPYTVREEAATIDLHPTGMLVLVYPGSPMMTYRASQDARLWRELHQPELLLRVYTDGLREWIIEDWITDCVLALETYEDQGVKVSGMILANEMDREGWGEDYTRIGGWLIEAAKSFRRSVPEGDILLHMPALSPGSKYYLPGYETLWQMNVGDYYDVIDCHVYSEEHILDLRFVDELFRKPICITEYNRLLPSALMEGLELGLVHVLGAYYFIQSWIDPEPGAPNVDLIRNPDFYEDFKQYIPVEEEYIMTRDELWRELTAQWYSYPALTKALVGMGGIPIGPERVIGNATFQLGAVPNPNSDDADPVVLYAETGDWENIYDAYIPEDLPEPYLDPEPEPNPEPPPLDPQ